MSTGLPPIAFNTTSWTKVYASCGSSPEAKLAMNQLCEMYYAPVSMFIRLARRNAADSEDLAQEFFAKLLSGKSWYQADPHRGRFRSYLLGAVKHFLADRDDYRRAKKRGGEHLHFSLSSKDTENGPSNENLIATDERAFPPDAYFDRAWAVQLLDRVLLTMETEHQQVGSQEQFRVLRNALTGQSLPADVAARLGVVDATVKVLVHRLRRRFRDLVKGEVAATLENPLDINQEIDYLIEALSYSLGRPFCD